MGGREKGTHLGQNPEPDHLANVRLSSPTASWALVPPPPPPGLCVNNLTITTTLTAKIRAWPSPAEHSCFFCSAALFCLSGEGEPSDHASLPREILIALQSALPDTPSLILKQLSLCRSLQPELSQ